MVAFIDKMMESYTSFQKKRAEKIVKKGKGRIFAVAASATFYFIERALDLILPIFGLMSMLSIALTPMILIPIGVAVFVFLVALTVNHTLNYINSLDKLKLGTAENEETDRQLVALDFEVMQVYDEIEVLERQLGITKIQIKPAIIKVEPEPEPEPELINQGFISKVLNMLYSGLIAIIQGTRQLISSVRDLLNLKTIVEYLIKVYGLVKLLLFSIVLAPVFPLVALLVIAKIYYVNPINSYIQEVDAQKAKQPALLASAQDAKALALKEKELLEYKLQAKLAHEGQDCTVLVQKPVLSIKVQLPLDRKPQDSVELPLIAAATAG